MSNRTINALEGSNKVFAEIPRIKRILNPDSTIGAILRQSRERQGLSARQLSELANLSQTTIFEIEKGERSLKVWELLPIARAYNINPIDIIKATAA
jgi:DNA-binding XRE family transcriptional regulator